MKSNNMQTSLKINLIMYQRMINIKIIFRKSSSIKNEQEKESNCTDEYDNLGEESRKKRNNYSYALDLILFITNTIE